MKNINILIIDKLTGEISEENNLLLVQWKNQKSENLIYYHEIKDLILNENNHNEKIFESNTALNNFKEKYSIRKTLNIYDLLKYSAVFILLLTISGLSINYFNNREISEEDYITVLVPKSYKRVILLSDGTEVKLNSGSMIKYPKEFRGDKRKVIIEGEAMFKVSPNKLKPFIVKTKHINIVVLGTTFNVSAYKDDEVVTASLIEGSVMVKFNESNQSIRIKPNQVVSYNIEQDKINIEDVNVENETRWVRNILIFKNEKFSRIIRKIERWYNVKIITSGIDVDKLFFTGTFENKSITEVMRIIIKISKCKCIINKNVIKLTKK